MLGAGLAFPVAAYAGPSRDDALLTQAMNAIGGRELLARVKVLSWEARAEMFVGDRPTSITAKTRCEPFGGVRFEINPVGAGPDTALTMVIGPDGGLLEFVGNAEPLPAEMVAHEREHFGIYSYLLLAHAPATAQDGKLLIAERPGYPRCVLHVDRRGAITSAEYNVISPDGPRKGAVGQWFDFAGRVEDKGVRFPKRTTIIRDGKPYFDMAIDRFAVELA